MSTHRSFLAGLLILSAAGLLAGHGATVAEARYSLDQGTVNQRGNDLWQTPQTPGSPVLRRASRLLGEPLKNTQGATLGKIKDMVLTPDLAQVSYAVISRGGLFGLGNRLYAIPWSALRAGVGDTVVAPIDPRELDQDRGFPAAQWPAEGDPRWLSRPGERTEQVTFDVQRPTEQREIRRRRISHVLGMAARGPNDDRFGTVKDILISMDTGDIPFTIVSYGGLLGLGTKYTAVPAHVVELQPADYVARIEANEQTLHANAFTPGSFPDLSDPVYSQRLYASYNVSQMGPGETVLAYIPPEEPARAQPRTTFPAQPQAAFPTQPQQMQTPARSQSIPGIQVPLIPAPGPIPGEYLAVFKPDNIRTIEGVVTGVSTFQLAGTNTEWVQLQVRADDGSLTTVHLGPRDYVSRQDFYVAANDRISLTGAQATAWRQPIILPISATVSGRTINLRDQTGRPLWEQTTQPQTQFQTQIQPQVQPPVQPQTQTQPSAQTPPQPQAQTQTQPQAQPQGQGQAQPQQNQSQPNQ